MEAGSLKDIPVKLEMETAVASEEDIKQLGMKFRSKRAFFNRKWAEGQKCVVVKQKGEIIGYCWLIDDRTTFRTNSAWTFVPSSPGGMWCDDFYIDDEHRLRGAYIALGRKVSEIAQSQKQFPVYSEIHYLNISSLRSAKAGGSRVIRTVYFFSIFGLKIYFIKDEKGRIQIDKAYALRVKLI
jgi:hypothetical protein